MPTSEEDDESTRALRKLTLKLKRDPIPDYVHPEADLEQFRRIGSFTTKFTGTTYKELLEYVIEATGLTEKAFNAGGYKTLEDLFEEYAKYDIALYRAKTGGRLLRVASSARAEIILPRPSGSLSLKEVRREFPKSGKPPIVHREPKRHGCSETIKRTDEDPITAMLRGFWEEYGLQLRRDDLIPIESGWPQTSIGDSSVYPKTLSFVKSWMFSFYSTKLLWPGGKVVVDGNVRIINKWLPFEPRLSEN